MLSHILLDTGVVVRYSGIVNIDFHILNYTRPEEGGCIVIR